MSDTMVNSDTSTSLRGSEFDSPRRKCMKARLYQIISRRNALHVPRGVGLGYTMGHSFGLREWPNLYWHLRSVHERMGPRTLFCAAYWPNRFTDEARMQSARPDTTLYRRASHGFFRIGCRPCSGLTASKQGLHTTLMWFAGSEPRDYQ